MNIDKFIDGGKSELLDGALADLRAEMNPIGIEIISLSWMGKPEYPQTVVASINAKVTANQKTLQRVQEVQQSKAEADKLIEEARGQAESVMLRAKAEADSINLRGDALRKNPEIMQLEAINKWNGILPQYMSPGAATPFIQVK